MRILKKKKIIAKGKKAEHKLDKILYSVPITKNSLLNMVSDIFEGKKAKKRLNKLRTKWEIEEQNEIIKMQRTDWFLRFSLEQSYKNYKEAGGTLTIQQYSPIWAKGGI